MITIDKKSTYNLLEYINTLLEAIDIEDEEMIDYINNGYDDFVKPLIKILQEQQETTK